MGNETRQAGSRTRLGISEPIEMFIIKGKGKDIAVCETSPHRYGKSYVITQCYLPPGRGDFSAFTPAEAGTQFSDAEGMQG